VDSKPELQSLGERLQALDVLDLLFPRLLRERLDPGDVHGQLELVEVPDHYGIDQRPFRDDDVIEVAFSLQRVGLLDDFVVGRLHLRLELGIDGRGTRVEYRRGALSGDLNTDCPGIGGESRIEERQAKSNDERERRAPMPGLPAAEGHRVSPPSDLLDRTRAARSAYASCPISPYREKSDRRAR
jgi:hypothetical protein